MNIRKFGLLLLLALGLSHIAGTLIQPMFPTAGAALAGIGRLSLASPHPKVFCQVGEHEPYGFEFTIEATTTSGHTESVSLDSSRYSRINGPYMYRNTYGAALSFSPFLDPNVIEQVLRYGLCESGDLNTLFDTIDQANIARAVVFTHSRRPGPHVEPVEVTCR